MTSQNRREARRNLKGHENRIIEHCAKSKQCDQLGALKMQNIEVLTLNMWLWNTYVVELKDGNRATIIDVRGKDEYFAEVVNAYGQAVAKRNIIDEEIK